MIDKETRQRWRREASNPDGMCSGLGEYTPPEFLELLDAYEVLAEGSLPADAMTRDELRDRWHREVYERGESEVDPDCQYTWEGLLLGWLLGAGVELEEALEIASGAPTNGWNV